MSGDKCFKLLPHNFKMVSYFSLWDLLLLLSHYGGRLQYHDSSLTLQLVKIYMFFPVLGSSLAHIQILWKLKIIWYLYIAFLLNLSTQTDFHHKSFSSNRTHSYSTSIFYSNSINMWQKKEKKEGCIPVYQSFTWTEDSGINPSTWATVFRFHLGLRLWYLCDHFHILFLFAPSTDQFSSWKSIMFFIH